MYLSVFLKNLSATLLSHVRCMYVSHAVLESAQLPALSSVVPPTGTTLLGPPSALSTTATTNALATITPSHPSPSSSLSPLPSTSFPPALQHPNAQSAANTSTVEFAAYPDW